MAFRIGELTGEEAVRIGEKINGIVPREVEADKEEFVLKIQGENGGIIGGCIAEAYESPGLRARRSPALSRCSMSRTCFRCA